MLADLGFQRKSSSLVWNFLKFYISNINTAFITYHDFKEQNYVFESAKWG